MGADDTQLVLFDDAGAHPLPRLPKPEAARKLMRAIAERLAQSTTKHKGHPA
jgi:phosphopantothenoylcysteine decarboxylase/phosphopantothenate--cysteine ligase